MTERHPTLDVCMAAMPDILAAPKDNAPIRSLCLRPGIGQRQFVDSLTMTVSEGIPGDRWLTNPWRKLADGSPDPEIQVSILPTRVCDLVWREGDRAPHPGDPIVADMDMGVDNLPPGSLIQAGSAVLEVSAIFNTACVKWRNRYGLESFRWINMDDHPRHRLRGILCAVREGGTVTRTDPLKILCRATRSGQAAP